MLETAEGLRPIDGRIEGSYDDLDGWSTVPLVKTVHQLRLYLGDPQTGPLLWLFHGTPMVFPEGQPRPEFIPLPAHLHQTPTFRIVVGEQPRQIMFDGVWQTQGEYLLLESNKGYVEPVGVDGHKQFSVFADRRGMHPANKDTASMTSDELVAWNSRRFGEFGRGLSRVFTHDDKGVAGATITTRTKLERGGRAKGFIDDQSDWTVLADGSRIAAAFMCDPASGPVVIMSRNAPHVVESPAGKCGTDLFRLVTKGSCTIGGREYTAGSFVALEAGAAVGEVVHGSEGSTQLVVVTDRRFWAPLDASGAPVKSARLNEVRVALAPYIAEPVRAD